MKTTIRQGTFKTNSSSTHSIVMYSDIEGQKMKNSEAWYDGWNEGIWTANEISDKIKELYGKDEKYWREAETVTPDIVKSVLQKLFKGTNNVNFDDMDYKETITNSSYGITDGESATLELLFHLGYNLYNSVSAWLDSQEDYETFSDSYTLPDGRVVYAEGYYGYN